MVTLTPIVDFSSPFNNYSG